ncbi:MAG TPA: lactoylglutathione lyase [Ruminococcaceae bacterium]|jgi:lactoylglutathione lyase|nr:lactoylglutathione lyase [Oscillospiraceae bacterium]HBG55481.1 lactoylglutathione lyase [Oscillospiraceae bacterium]HBQ46134.1 lactoylglutathione lyase [Oscillospiraceae bacterium]HBT91389.1 lactoylglutathione lyase [Oscillospiraceae bacterium]HCB90810.1 lactoylglutathione lyase [Oscillospiraceae bacterium]
MQSRFLHTNFNVFNLQKSIDFYEKALGLKEVRRINAPDGSFIIAYLGDGQTDYALELTWMRDRKKPYDLGDNEIHIAFRVPDKKAAHALHEKMGCICYENRAMDLYFISDPDGYWIEILDR